MPPQTSAPALPMPSPPPYPSKGFTLVEVTLTLAVMGLIGAMTFPLLSHLLTQQKVNRTESILESARSEALGFAMRTYQLPGSTAFLGHRQDAWRSALEFRAADIEAEDLCAFFASNNATAMRMEISGGIVDNLAFILVSPGPNRQLQTDLTPSLEDPDNPESLENPIVIEDPGTEVGGKRYDDLHVFMTMDSLRTRVLCPEEGG